MGSPVATTALNPVETEVPVVPKLSVLIALVTLPVATAAVVAQANPEAVLARALAYHDPDNRWPTLNAHFEFAGSRPDAELSTSRMTLDNARSFMQVDMAGKESYEITGESVRILAGDKDEARGRMMRNYFLYLWGLPMKLQDAGTVFDPTVGSSAIDGVTCDVIRVIYEQDTWFFHIDQKTGRMRQYEFYQDDTKAAGEIITLSGEVEVAGIRIPQKRAWYKIPGRTYLGTDVLIKATMAKP